MPLLYSPKILISKKSPEVNTSGLFYYNENSFQKRVVCFYLEAVLHGYPFNASAPATISKISLVMAA